MEQKAEALHLEEQESNHVIGMPNGGMLVSRKNISVAAEVVHENAEEVVIERNVVVQETHLVNEKYVIPKRVSGEPSNISYSNMHANVENFPAAENGTVPIHESQESSTMEIASQESVESKMDISSQESTSKMDISSLESDSLEISADCSSDTSKKPNTSFHNGSKSKNAIYLEMKTVSTDTSFLNCEATVLFPEDLAKKSTGTDESSCKKTRSSPHKRSSANIEALIEVPENDSDLPTGRKRVKISADISF